MLLVVKRRCSWPRPSLEEPIWVPTVLRKANDSSRGERTPPLPAG
jgi:hypothetical protein